MCPLTNEGRARFSRLATDPEQRGGGERDGSSAVLALEPPRHLPRDLGPLLLAQIATQKHDRRGRALARPPNRGGRLGRKRMSLRQHLHIGETGVAQLRGKLIRIAEWAL